MYKPKQMHVVHPHHPAFAGKRANLEVIQQEKFHQLQELHGLLIPWFRFRIYVKFFPTKTHIDRPAIPITRTCYGWEHDCTYKQCLFGHVEKINLDRLAGYNRLLKMLEPNGAFYGQYISATLYGRDENGNFNCVHRQYMNNQLDEARVNDPAIDSADQLKTLEYFIQNHRVVIVDPNSVKS